MLFLNANHGKYLKLQKKKYSIIKIKLTCAGFGTIAEQFNSFFVSVSAKTQDRINNNFQQIKKVI